MSLGFQECLVSQDQAATLFNTYTTAKSVLHPNGLYQFRPNELRTGQTLRITAMFGLSNIVTTPGTITLQVVIGGVVVFTTGAIQLNATAHTLLPHIFEALLTVRAKGSGTNANMIGFGRVQGIAPTLTAGQTDPTNVPGIYPAPATAPAVGGGFDTSISNLLDFFAGFSISAGGNGIQVQQYLVESLN